MIVFEKIRRKNFLSTGNVFTEVDLNRHPNTLIVGENGAGKSTILDAICFGLFGKPFRKITKQQLVNTINGKGTFVEVEFTIGSNQYKIVRGIKKYGSSPFEIYVNNEMINQPGASRDYQAYLEDTILKLNFKSFTQIVILGNASFTPFMQLPATHRREIIEDLLDIKVFSAMNILLKDRLAENSEDLRDVKYKLDLAGDKLQVHESYLLELQQNKTAQVEANQAEIDKTKETIESLVSDIEEQNKEINQLSESINDHEQIKAKMKKIELLEVQIEDKVRKLKKDIKFFEENDNCPTCKQDLNAEIVKEQLDSKRDSLRTTNDALEQLTTQYNAVNSRLNEIISIQDTIINKQTNIQGKTSEITAQQSYVSKIQQEIENILNAEDNNTETKKAIKTLKTAISKLDKKQEELVNMKHLLDVAADLLRDKGIKTSIVKQYVPVMNKLVNKYLAAMDFFVNFELDENFNEVIKSRHRDIFSYASFSEGEKMRIDLSLLFTWRAIAKMKNSASTNLLILDEVFDASLDGGGCDEFLKLIHQMGKETNVFVISHKGDVLADKFFSTIRFEKHKDFSRIAE